MSIQLVGWVLEHERTTTGADRLVLIALANYADERGECYPSIGRIQRDAGIKSETTVHACIGRLIDAGLLERRVKAAPDERIRLDRRPNLYRLVRTPATVDNPVDTVDDPPGIGESVIHRPPNDWSSDPPKIGGETVSRTVIKTSLSRASARSALVEVCGLREEDLTSTARRALERDLDRLLQVDVGPDLASEIQRRAESYRLKWPEATLTSAALVRHWPRLWRPTVVHTVVVRCAPCGQAMSTDGTCHLDPALVDCPSISAVEHARPG